MLWFRSGEHCRRGGIKTGEVHVTNDAQPDMLLGGFMHSGTNAHARPLHTSVRSFRKGQACAARAGATLLGQDLEVRTSASSFS